MAAKFVVIVEDLDLDAFCLQDHYQETIKVDGVETPNPETKEDYVERRVGEYVGNTAVAGKALVRQPIEKAAREADEAATEIVTAKG